MSSRFTLPDIGRVVEIVRGRDCGMLFVVIGHAENRFVWVADGHRRRADKPKKKNVLHLRSTDFMADEVIDDIERLGHVTNARLRNAVKKAQQAMGRIVEEMHEGGTANGQG